jgi:hypothetical protein
LLLELQQLFSIKHDVQINDKKPKKKLVQTIKKESHVFSYRHLKNNFLQPKKQDVAKLPSKVKDELTPQLVLSKS